MDDRPLPSGFAVFTTFPELLFIWELVFGGLVWILIASSLVPFPLIQGWVMFVSLSCFIGTTALLFVYITDGNKWNIPCLEQDTTYHYIASLFYLSASVLEAWATVTMEGSVTREHFLENVFATVFACLVTLLYMVHACCLCR
ncbi:myelin and lymphocyte protein-like [Diceros bicornis minor]|uniref:myelin and lymphocyte protein-like n=1 Tax=Diceros bicornis minor TaxID=77932 RepID=UPI0026EA1E4F|nr:myelin and lymphocyte protein-like [Diceros bicornis minor]